MLPAGSGGIGPVGSAGQPLADSSLLDERTRVSSQLQSEGFSTGIAAVSRKDLLANGVSQALTSSASSIPATAPPGLPASGLAVGETLILLYPLLPSVGV